LTEKVLVLVFTKKSYLHHWFCSMFVNC